MTTPPTAPAPGKPVSATFFSRLISWVKSGQLIEGPGYGIDRGPYGTRIKLKKENQKIATVPRCFDIRRATGEDNGGFYRPYFRVADRVYKSTTAESCGFDYEDCIVALQIDTTSDIPDATVVSYDSFEDLQTAQEDLEKSTIPLYEIGEEGRVLADFRNAPTFCTWEFDA